MKKINAFKLFLRAIMLLLGMFFIALGVAFSTKSGLGVSPSAAIPFVLSSEGVTPLSMGTITTIINCLMIVVQIALLRKNYKPIQLLQLLVVFIFGFFTDFTLMLVKNLELNSYPVRLLFCVISCFVMGFGVFLEVKANLITMSSEGAISAVCKIVKKAEFGKVKMALDISFVIIGVILSFVFHGKLIGVREGTIIAALLVGFTVQIYNRYLGFITLWLGDSKEPTLESVASGDTPLIITIERELGTGGHEIGKKIAEELGIAFYDQHSIVQRAQELGLEMEDVGETEEKLPSGLIYTLYNQSYAAEENLAKQDTVFLNQQRIIREFAAKESCVIVGRLGSYALKNRENACHIFISASIEARAKNLSEKLGMPIKVATKLVKNEDHARKQYCEHFTGSHWGLAWHYGITLDTTDIAVEDSVELIKTYVDKSK